MKKISILLLSLVLLSGCSVHNKSLNHNGLSFEYPEDLMTVSFDDFDPFEGENIYVDVTSIGDFVQPCVDLVLQRDENAIEYQVKENYTDMFKNLKKKGVDEEISNFDNLSCGWTKGNISAKPIIIDDISGVIYNKALTQIEGSLTVFFTQIVLVDEYDRIYSIVFNYDFGELAEYLSSIKTEYGEAILDEKDFDKYYEVYNYFAFENPITTPELLGFVENRKVIESIIDSIKINN